MYIRSIDTVIVSHRQAYQNLSISTIWIKHQLTQQVMVGCVEVRNASINEVVMH